MAFGLGKLYVQDSFAQTVAYAALLARRGFSSVARGRRILLSRGHGVMTLLGALTLFCAGVVLLLGRLVG